MLSIFEITGYEKWYIAAAGMNDALEFFANEYDLDDAGEEELKIRRYNSEEVLELFLELEPEEAKELLESMRDYNKPFVMNEDNIEVANKREAQIKETIPEDLVKIDNSILINDNDRPF